jgi:hypothetical protein
MRSVTSRRALTLGLGASLLYLALAVVSGHLSPLARRPLLDGFAPPAAYRFVHPPSNLASINKRPLAGQFTLQVRNGTVTEGLFATGDSQASITLFRRAVRAPAGARSMAIKLQPLAPPKSASLPGKMSITGNVYTVSATFRPGGRPLRRLEKQGIVALTYPALAGGHHTRKVLFSSDGVRFMELSSVDSSVQQQVTAHTPSLGFFAVGVKSVAAPTQPTGGSGFPVTAVVVGAAIVVAVVVGWLRWRERNRARTVRRRPPRRSSGGARRRR